jgi:predicted dehydrogenase
MALMSLVVGPQRSIEPRPFTERDDASLGNGFLWALGSHYIDCLRHWFGEIEAVGGHVSTLLGDRIHLESGQTVQATADDTFHFTVRFAQGGWATMTGTNAAPFGPGGRVEIYGRDGALVTPHRGRGFNPPAHGTLLAARTGDEGLTEQEIPERLQPFVDDRDDRLMPFRLLVREFLRGIQEGSSPAPNFYDGFRCQQVLDAIRKASATGQVIAIPPEG